MTIDWQTAERMQCSREEKNEVVTLVELVVQASEKARFEGLLAIEDDIHDYAHPFFKLGMQLVVDGTDPEIIESVLRARLFSACKKGKDLLEQIIIIDAVLSIQSGDNPRIIMAKCFSYFGDDADEIQQKFISDVLENRESDSFDGFIGTDGSATEYFPKTRRILSFDNRSIRKILREIDTSELSAVLHGAESAVRKKILDNMSRRAGHLLVMETRATLKETVAKNVERLFELIDGLQQAGEVPRFE